MADALQSNLTRAREPPIMCWVPVMGVLQMCNIRYLTAMSEGKQAGNKNVYSPL
jgi:hypothetical protein